MFLPSWEMKLAKIGGFWKLAELWILKPNDLLVAQDPFRETEPRNSVGVKKALFVQALSSSNHRC